MADRGRIDAQLAFLTEADLLKSVDRANMLTCGTRLENTAEHSWHLALWALVFGADAPAGVDVTRSILMLLLHDLVEIDAGDHPINIAFDPAEVAAKEQAAADRLFGLLPADQGADLRGAWDEFEAAQTPTAQFAKALDLSQPIFQIIHGVNAPADHPQIARDNLATGRAAILRDRWPEMYAHASGLLSGAGSPLPDDHPLPARLRFLIEADRLKTVIRATRNDRGGRHENAGEHSWHVALFAHVLAEHAAHPVDPGRVVAMMLIHDLVEIDTGDVPIHSANGNAHGGADVLAAEQAAADRIFGLLPEREGAALRALWDEFEAAESPDAIFAKAIDRVQPVIANLETGGGTWPEYNVTPAQLQSRVGVKVDRGAPAIWAALRDRIDAWFSMAAE